MMEKVLAVEEPAGSRNLLEYRGPQYGTTPNLPEFRGPQHGPSQNTRHLVGIDTQITSHL